MEQVHKENFEHADVYTTDGRNTIYDRLANGDISFTKEEIEIVQHVLEAAYTGSIYGSIGHCEWLEKRLTFMKKSGSDMVLAGFLVKCFRDMRYIG